MSISFSISTTMVWLYRMFFLLSLLSSLEFGHRGSTMVTGFEASSSFISPKRAYESVRRAEERSSKPRPSFCKYDLGIGKNEPLLPNVADTTSANTATEYSHGDDTCIGTYEACRFLVEHETTRDYPAPEATRTDTNFSNDANLADRRVDTTRTTISREATPSSISNPTNDRNTQKKQHHQQVWGTKAISKKTDHTALEKSRKPNQPVKVQPKRLLEDCLIILDHDDFSESSAAAAPISMNSTIWSHPDTPQLDMNSIWVEMLLHNQMGIAQQQQS